MFDILSRILRQLVLKSIEDLTVRLELHAYLDKYFI